MSEDTVTVQRQVKTADSESVTVDSFRGYPSEREEKRKFMKV